MSISSATPILSVNNAEAAKEFYVNFLGFNVDWEHRFEASMPSYMQVSRDGCKLHLTEQKEECTHGAALRIHVDALDEFHDQLMENSTAAHLAEQVPDVEPKPWGTRDMSIEDPFGNRLTFSEEFCSRYHDVPA